ncbi:hypothetical protein LTR97_007675 [Elasticomyces elasticus]|uniref:Zn(2)-C6 fungal-type domain-containing protein n=1 Tax=Elasticomyces elasticus TaxID=574655 RepID=A0AAN8A118_9PEZI|nr:hypothetical protein LTR97_007675 [Elasticomyces elasticus]
MQTFHFVSDPNHKENLSGRVTAACLNCRRKKIKCSGEADCKQCRDKGLLCEGPPSRKRPNHETAIPNSDEGLDAATPHRHDPGDTQGPSGHTLQRPHTLSKPDSGYASNERESQSSYNSPIPVGSPDSDTGPGRFIHPLPIRRPHQHIAPASERSGAELPPSSDASQDISPFAFTQTFRGYTPGGFDDSNVTAGHSEWGSVPRGGSGGPPLRSLTTTSLTFQRHAPEDHVLNSAPTSETGITGSAYSNSRQRRPPAKLIEDAEALEEEASSLRQLAHRRSSFDSNVYNAQQHILPSQQMSQPSNPDQLAFGASPTSMVGSPYQFDPSTIFRPDGTLRTGLTPTGGAYGAWDVHMQNSHSFDQQPQYTFPQQAHVPSNRVSARSNRGSVSSGSSRGSKKPGRMQRAFHAQLVADQEAAASAARSDQGGEQAAMYHTPQ